MATGLFNTVLKNKFDLKILFNPFKKTNSATKTLIDIKNLRNIQWKQYKKPYLQFRSNLNISAKEILGQSLKLVNLSSFGRNSKITDIQNIILVPEKTRLAEMSCIDEATQGGDFVDEKNLNGDPLGTISDPNAARYILDIPGSGALNYECNKIDNTELSLEELVQIENERLDKLARRIVNWSQKRNIFKFTVTYHCNCGAVRKRVLSFPQLCNGNELKVAQDCANATARKIRIKALEVGYDLEVTTAFIGDKQMCKLRPLEMHNAIGTIGTLDSRVLANKLDDLAQSNFFDVFVHSEFQYEEENPEVIKTIVSEASRNILLTINIATGDNGWGKNHFSKDNPYLIILFASGESQQTEGGLIAEEIKLNLDQKDQEKLDFYIVRTDL